jgi:hypothetical protein
MKQLSQDNANWQKYLLTMLLGAVAGGVLVAVMTKAIPRMAAEIMAGMMGRMMAEHGCNPVEM